MNRNFRLFLKSHHNKLFVLLFSSIFLFGCSNQSHEDNKTNTNKPSAAVTKTNKATKSKVIEPEEFVELPYKEIPQSPEEQIRAMRAAKGENFVTDSSVRKQAKVNVKVDPSWNSQQNKQYNYYNTNTYAYKTDATPSYATTNSTGEVHVKGYYRKDGTYVAPHTRAKGSRSSGRRRR